MLGILTYLYSSYRMGSDCAFSRIDGSYELDTYITHDLPLYGKSITISRVLCKYLSRWTIQLLCYTFSRIAMSQHHLSRDFIPTILVQYFLDGFFMTLRGCAFRFHPSLKKSGTWIRISSCLLRVYLRNSSLHGLACYYAGSQTCCRIWNFLPQVKRKCPNIVCYSKLSKSSTRSDQYIRNML